MKILKLALLGAAWLIFLAGCQGQPTISPALPSEASALTSPANDLPATPQLTLPATQKPTLPASTQPSPIPTILPEVSETPLSVYLPTSQPEQILAPARCTEEHGTIYQHSLPSPLDIRPWEFRVYTPPCYSFNLDQRFPLLILIHGSTYTDDQWDRLGADETADRLITSGELPPFLILMPRDRMWTEPDEDPFGEGLIEYILPWVDENYRTIPEKESRAIGGLSRGGAWAIHLGLSHYELFGSIGAHSAPVFFTDPGRIERWLDKIPIESMPRISQDIGKDDYLIRSAIWFEEVLTRRGIPHKWSLFSGRHEEEYWARNMERYLRWYAEPWQP